MTEIEPLGRRERNKAEKRARILAAATRLLDERGYDGTTMAQVAAEADVAIGTVFQYAATKAELLMMVTADRWAGVLPGAPTGSDPVGQILTLLQPVADATRDQPELAMVIARELLFGAEGEHRDQVVALVAELEDAVAEVLRACGATDEERAQAASRLIVSGALMEANRSRTGRASGDSLAARLRALVQVAVAGALTHPPTSAPRTP